MCLDVHVAWELKVQEEGKAVSWYGRMSQCGLIQDQSLGELGINRTNVACLAEFPNIKWEFMRTI